MKKRIFAFAAAMLMLLCCTLPVFAVGAVPLKIIVEDPYPTEPSATASAAAERLADVLAAMQNVWKKYGVLLIIILVLLCIVTAITISEKEQEKKRREALKKQPHKKHEK